MKKILITGADGFLGVRAAAIFRQRGWAVLACGHGALDITDAAAVRGLLRREAPEAVLHCAAFSDTGFCQAHPELSEAVNLHGTENLAAACGELGAKLVYCSSDQVYGGCGGCAPLPEPAAAPNNMYGVHKEQAEQAAARLCPTAVGLRLTWMYDRPESAYRMNRNLLVNLRTASESGVPLRGAGREWRGISFVWDVAERLEACFDLSGGVYNFGCENTQSTYETLCAAAALCGYDANKLIQKDETFFRNLSMDCTKLRGYRIAFPDTIEGLRRALKADIR